MIKSLKMIHFYILLAFLSGFCFSSTFGLVSLLVIWLMLDACPNMVDFILRRIEMITPPLFQGRAVDPFQGISIDSFGWVNMILQEIWATKRLHVEDRVQNQIWPDIVEECNVLCCFGMHWHSITLEKFTLGDIPFEICNIQVWEENQLGDLVFDIEMKYEGNSCATIKFIGEIFKLPMPLTVQNFRIQSAKIRLVLKCVNFERRFVSGIHFGFLEPPQFEWNLSEWNGWHLIPSADKVIISK